MPEQYGTLVETIKAIEGGGGTRPSCINDWMDKQEPKSEYVAAIVLSDGQVGSDWGRWSIPVLWALNTKGITAGTGQTVYISSEEWNT
jgi:predicted metal-dependent peptidase